jgi:hypothetical protein
MQISGSHKAANALPFVLGVPIVSSTYVVLSNKHCKPTVSSTVVRSTDVRCTYLLQICKNSENQDLFYPVTHLHYAKKKPATTSVDLIPV